MPELVDWSRALAAACPRHYLTWLGADGASACVRYEREEHRFPFTWLLEWSGASDPDAAGPLALAFVAGASSAIRVPLRRGLTFSSVAGAIFPRVVNEAFVRGHEAAGGRMLFARPIAHGLVAAYVIEDDWGYSYLTEGRVQCWGTTDDRVTSAARSNLYTSTVAHRPTAVSTPVPYEVVAAGDGFDSGRVMLFNDAYWERLEAGIVFAVPSQDCLLMAEAQGSGAAAALASRAAEVYAAAAVPVSRQVYAAQGRRIECIPTTDRP